MADRWNLPVVTWLLFCLALAYVPDIGRGFISDDFAWILNSDLQSLRDLGRTFVETPMGFYRPLTSLSFAVNRELTGLAPMGYALVNLALVCGVGVAIAALCRTLGFTRLEGWFAAAIWTFNLHGVGMALTWISGRTSLLATLFAVLAAIAFGRRQRWLAGLWTLAALLSKEEPLLLPLVLAAWAVIDERANGARWPASAATAARLSWPAAAAVGVYLLLRFNTAALTPWNAPSYYTFSLAPGVFVPNVLEYADRAMTFGAAVLVLALVAFVRRRPNRSWVDRHERRVVLKGAIWLILGYGLTVMVPVRSDLYACLPAVGAALMTTAIGRGVWRAIPSHRRRPAVVLLLALPLLLVPVYRGRNVFARHDAELSTHVLQRVFEVLRERDDLKRVEVYQHAGERPSIGAAFGGGLPAAILLGTGRSLDATVHLSQPSDPWPAPQPETLRVTVAGDDILAVTPPQ